MFSNIKCLSYSLRIIGLYIMWKEPNIVCRILYSKLLVRGRFIIRVRHVRKYPGAPGIVIIRRKVREGGDFSLGKVIQRWCLKRIRDMGRFVMVGVVDIAGSLFIVQ